MVGLLLPVHTQARYEAVCSHEGLGLISNLGCIRAALLVNGNKGTLPGSQPPSGSTVFGCSLAKFQAPWRFRMLRS